VDWKGNSPTGTKYAAADAVYLGSRDKVYMKLFLVTVQILECLSSLFDLSVKFRKNLHAI
jgi:hypothetical protein